MARSWHPLVFAAVALAMACMPLAASADVGSDAGTPSATTVSNTDESTDSAGVSASGGNTTVSASAQKPACDCEDLSTCTASEKQDLQLSCNKSCGTLSWTDESGSSHSCAKTGGGCTGGSGTSCSATDLSAVASRLTAGEPVTLLQDGKYYSNVQIGSASGGNLSLDQVFGTGQGPAAPASGSGLMDPDLLSPIPESELAPANLISTPGSPDPASDPLGASRAPAWGPTFLVSGSPYLSSPDDAQLSGGNALSGQYRAPVEVQPIDYSGFGAGTALPDNGGLSLDGSASGPGFAGFVTDGVSGAINVLGGAVRSVSHAVAGSAQTVAGAVGNFLGTTPVRNAAGIANNNPGNVSCGSGNWVGNSGCNGRFVQFSSPEYGIRAGAINLANQQRLDGIDTIRGVITKYAPPSDNNDTAAYVAAVSAQTGYGPDQKIDLTDSATNLKVFTAIMQHENGGIPYSADQVAQGYSLAGMPVSGASVAQAGSYSAFSTGGQTEIAANQEGPSALDNVFAYLGQDAPQGGTGVLAYETESMGNSALGAINQALGNPIQAVTQSVAQKVQDGLSQIGAWATGKYAAVEPAGPSVTISGSEVAQGSAVAVAPGQAIEGIGLSSADAAVAQPVTGADLVPLQPASEVAAAPGEAIEGTRPVTAQTVTGIDITGRETGSGIPAESGLPSGLHDIGGWAVPNAAGQQLSWTGDGPFLPSDSGANPIAAVTARTPSLADGLRAIGGWAADADAGATLNGGFNALGIASDGAPAGDLRAIGSWAVPQGSGSGMIEGALDAFGGAGSQYAPHVITSPVTGEYPVGAPADAPDGLYPQTGLFADAEAVAASPAQQAIALGPSGALAIPVGPSGEALPVGGVSAAAAGPSQTIAGSDLSPSQSVTGVDEGEKGGGGLFSALGNMAQSATKNIAGYFQSFAGPPAPESGSAGTQSQVDEGLSQIGGWALPSSGAAGSQTEAIHAAQAGAPARPMDGIGSLFSALGGTDLSGVTPVLTETTRTTAGTTVVPSQSQVAQSPQYQQGMTSLLNGSDIKFSSLSAGDQKKLIGYIPQIVSIASDGSLSDAEKRAQITTVLESDPGGKYAGHDTGFALVVGSTLPDSFKQSGDLSKLGLGTADQAVAKITGVYDSAEHALTATKPGTAVTGLSVVPGSEVGQALSQTPMETSIGIDQLYSSSNPAGSGAGDGAAGAPAASAPGTGGGAHADADTNAPAGSPIGNLISIVGRSGSSIGNALGSLLSGLFGGGSSSGPGGASGQGAAARPALTCSPDAIINGTDATVTIAWQCDSVSASADGTGFPLSGAAPAGRAIITAATTAGEWLAYGIRCSDGTSNTCQVRVEHPLVTLVAFPRAVVPGAAAQIGWSGADIVACALFDADGALVAHGGANGSYATMPLGRSVIFRMACRTSAGAIVTASTTVPVTGDTAAPADTPLPASVPIPDPR